MSAEGQTYVEKYSPYTGAVFQVHLRLGLLSNDAHGHEIFCGDKYLMDKCRASERTVGRAKAILIRDGFLRQISPAVGRRPAHYEFIFRGVEIGSQNDRLSEIGGHPVQNRWPSATSSPIYRKEMKRSDDESFPQVESVPMPRWFKESLGMT